ncbi:MAG TPA: LPS export ABC transporter ATP-binding protein [Candidatus Hypogeohydataceae bacterium YC41]
MKLLEVENLTKIYGKRVVLNGLNLEVGKGEVVGLLGHNGAGKSTAFGMIVGLIRPNNGRIYFQGQDITWIPIYKRARMGLGYLSQEPSVFQRLSVEDNLLAVLEVRRRLVNKRLRSAQLLEDFGLTHLAKKKAYTLSGGEKRRLELARAMATTPSMLLLDEPFSGIDPIALSELQAMVMGLKRIGIGILLTDHNVREALSITDRAYILNEGEVMCHGTTAEIVNDPVAIKSYLGEGFTVEIKAPEACWLGEKDENILPTETRESSPEGLKKPGESVEGKPQLLQLSKHKKSYWQW